MKEKKPGKLEFPKKFDGFSQYRPPLSFVEEQMHRELGAGGSMLYLMDLNRMHDVGRGFGIGFDGRPENYTFGAFGEPVEHELMDKPSYYWIR